MLNFERIAADLALIIRQHPHQIRRRTFILSLKNQMNQMTADRFFSALMAEKYIIAVKPRVYRFTIDKNFLNCEKLVEFFDQHDIKRVHNPMLHKSPEEKARIYAQMVATRRERKLAKQQEVATMPEPIKGVQATIELLAAFSDEELQAELNRRSEIRSKKEMLHNILSLAEISLDDLKALIALAE
jgi:hypothetical protein